MQNKFASHASLSPQAHGRFAMAAVGLAATLACGTVAAQVQPVQPVQSQANGWALGRIIVAPKSGLPELEFDKILKGHGTGLRRKLDGINVHVIELPIQSRGREHALVQALARNPHIKFAEVDAFVAPAASANDTYFPNAWHLATTRTTSAWDSSVGSGVTIAILDSGVDASHPDLAGKLVPGYNFFDGNSNTADVYGHGTKAAGTAAAITNNAAGVSAVAADAKIMPIRVAGTDGWATWSALANGTTWAADRGARVISMSFQNPSSSAAVLSAANYARSKGAVVIGAAGNTSGYDATAASELMTIVAATDGSDARAGWSTYGPSVDIAAPGVGIYTTTSGGGYGAWSGTSAATPVTAGVAALVIAANPALKPADVDRILQSTALDLGSVGKDEYHGHGRVDAAAAVAAARSAVTTDTQSPSVAIASPTGGSVKGITTVDVSASDNVGVSKVSLFLAGTLLASDADAPYSFSWDTTKVGDGATTLVAKAYDASGNVGTSQSISVTVANSTGNVVDSTPPVVTISNPKNGSVVSGTVTVAVGASDNVQVAGVTLYINGAQVASGSSSLSYKWNARKAPKGANSIQAVARDSSGNSTTSSIQVTR
ncbi:MAG TPA: S8 family serine peptidase [Rubrivivax sp.]|nr:S8 family serine peptidase [Rubrivivax sp.]